MMPGWSIVYGKYFSCGKPVFYWLLQSFSFNHMLEILMCFTATFLGIWKEDYSVRPLLTYIVTCFRKADGTACLSVSLFHIKYFITFIITLTH